jgi:hypothetical protein
MSIVSIELIVTDVFDFLPPSAAITIVIEILSVLAFESYHFLNK